MASARAPPVRPRESAPVPRWYPERASAPCLRAAWMRVRTSCWQLEFRHLLVWQESRKTGCRPRGSADNRRRKHSEICLATRPRHAMVCWLPVWHTRAMQAQCAARACVRRYPAQGRMSASSLSVGLLRSLAPHHGPGNRVVLLPCRAHLLSGLDGLRSFHALPSKYSTLPARNTPGSRTVSPA